MLKKVISILCLSIFIVLPSKLYAATVLENDLHAVAVSLAKAAEYVKLNISRNGFNLTTNIPDFSAGLHTIASLSVNNTTAAITATFGTGDAISSNLRAMTVTLTPQYEKVSNSTLTDFDRTTDNGIHHIDHWTCAVDNSTSGANYLNYNYFGRTRNLHSETRVTPLPLENVFADYCSDVAITTA
jgi:hypothetical protein